MSGGIDPADPLPGSPFRVSDTILSQYANSPVILALATAFADAIDQTPNIAAFFIDIWDIDTATGYGLDVWGRIVGVSRALTVPASGDFGFSDGGYAPFGQGPFYSYSPASNTYLLADGAYRLLILCKALSNISASTAPAINAMLRLLFAGRGRCYSADLGAMQMMLAFEFPLRPYELAILTQSGALPRPAGVQSYVLQTEGPALRLGFGAGTAPFGQGTFFGDPASAI